VNEQELAARAEDLIAAWNERDVDRLVVAYSVDARLRDPAGGATRTGREAIRADAERVLAAMPDLRFELRRTTVGGNVVVQEWVARAEHFERDVVVISEFDSAGRITAFTRYW
jgi:hypothetical protein